MKHQCYICLKWVDRIYPVDAYTTVIDMCAKCLQGLIGAADATHKHHVALAEKVQALG